MQFQFFLSLLVDPFHMVFSFLFSSVELRRLLSFLLPKGGIRGWSGGKGKKNMASSAGPGSSLYFLCTLRAEMSTYIAITGPWGDGKETCGDRENSYLLSTETMRH